MTRWRSHDRRLALYAAIVGGLLIANNSLPYLGLRDDSCQTMFAGLEWTATTNNHWFVPQRSLGDGWASITDVEVAIEPPPRTERHAYLASWLAREERALNLDAVRAVVDQLCGAGHRVRMRYRSRPTGPVRTARDACREPALSAPAWWVPVRRFETDEPAEPRG